MFGKIRDGVIWGIVLGRKGLFSDMFDCFVNVLFHRRPKWDTFGGLFDLVRFPVCGTGLFWGIVLESRLFSWIVFSDLVSSFGAGVVFRDCFPIGSPVGLFRCSLRGLFLDNGVPAVFPRGIVSGQRSPSGIPQGGCFGTEMSRLCSPGGCLIPVGDHQNRDVPEHPPELHSAPPFLPQTRYIQATCPRL